jgi:hypothetical protein
MVLSLLRMEVVFVLDQVSSEFPFFIAGTFAAFHLIEGCAVVLSLYL